MDRDSGSKTPKTMLEIECWEATQFLKLPFFLEALGFSPLIKGSEASEAFLRLLENGLSLHVSEHGNCSCDEKIDNSDVKQALNRIDDALFECNGSKNKVFNGEIIKTSAGNDVSMASLLVRRDDVSVVFTRLGFESFPWAKVPWPIDQTYFCDFPIQANEIESLQEYVSYFVAKLLLEKTLETPISDEEMWMWCFLCKKLGGIDPYEINGVNKSIIHHAGFCLPTHTNESEQAEYRLVDLKRKLKHWRFLSDEIKAFRPERRYVTGQQLSLRWTELLNDNIAAKEKVMDYSCRLFQERNPNDRPYLYNQFPWESETDWNSIEHGVFLLEDVLAIEAYDHIEKAEPIHCKDKTGIDNSLTSGLAEIVHNGKSINWDYWASRLEISPEQAARLAHCIDPIAWPNEEYEHGPIPKDLLTEITALTGWLKERGGVWRLSGLVSALGADLAPYSMVQAVGTTFKQVPDKPIAYQLDAADDVSRSNPPNTAITPQATKTAKEVVELLRPMVKDTSKLESLLLKNASKTKWLADCKCGKGYNLPKIIKAHAERGLLKEEYQKQFSEKAIEKALAVSQL